MNKQYILLAFISFFLPTSTHSITKATTPIHSYDCDKPLHIINYWIRNHASDNKPFPMDIMLLIQVFVGQLSCKEFVLNLETTCNLGLSFFDRTSSATNITSNKDRTYIALSKKLSILDVKTKQVYEYSYPNYGQGEVVHISVSDNNRVCTAHNHDSLIVWDLNQNTSEALVGPNVNYLKVKNLKFCHIDSDGKNIVCMDEELKIEHFKDLGDDDESSWMYYKTCRTLYNFNQNLSPTILSERRIEYHPEQFAYESESCSFFHWYRPNNAIIRTDCASNPSKTFFTLPKNQILTCLQVSNKYLFLATDTKNKYDIKILNKDNGNIIDTITTDHNYPIKHLASTPDGSVLLSSPGKYLYKGQRYLWIINDKKATYSQTFNVQDNLGNNINLITSSLLGTIMIINNMIYQITVIH